MENIVIGTYIYYCADCQMAYVSHNLPDYKCPNCLDEGATSIIKNHNEIRETILKLSENLKFITKNIEVLKNRCSESYASYPLVIEDNVLVVSSEYSDIMNGQINEQYWCNLCEREIKSLLDHAEVHTITLKEYRDEIYRNNKSEQGINE